MSTNDRYRGSPSNSPTPTTELVAEDNGIATAVAAGRLIGEASARATIFRVNDAGDPLVVLNPGQTITDLEHFLPAPLRICSTVSLHDAASFVSYVKRYAQPSASLVFGDLVGRKFEAVIDYHGAPGTPSWAEHRAILACKTTQEWDEWIGMNATPRSQVEFARFVEEHIPHIAEPAGAKLLEMCLTLEAKKDVAFRASTRLENGQHQFRYEEQITGTAGASQTGTLAIPTGFVLMLEPFKGIGKKQIEARFRYRIDGGGKLLMWYDLVRPVDVLEKAFDEVVAKVQQGLDPILVVAGAAPPAGR